jgi:hypothetical protein
VITVGSANGKSTDDRSGAVALLLLAPPGLTPPRVKAILQYTVQP